MQKIKKLSSVRVYKNSMDILMEVLHKLFSIHSTNCNKVIKIYCISFKLNFKIILKIYRTNVKLNFARWLCEPIFAYALCNSTKFYKTTR